MLELLQRFVGQEVVDDGDLGMRVCHRASMSSVELFGLSARPPPNAVAVRKMEASRARDTGAIEVFASV